MIGGDGLAVRLRSLFVRANAVLLAFASALHAFDARLFKIRATTAVQHDSLVHYNMLLAWWRHGDSPRGFTLTPSPYFIDMLVEFPLMLLAPDFERWSYALACAYAVLIFAALYLVVRLVLGSSTALAATITGLTVIAFYKLAPFDFVVHTFVVNHTSEIFATLGMIVVVWAWLRPGVRRRSYAPYAYVVLVAGCVLSSPFFIATYCLPTVVAVAAISGTESIPVRRFAWFCGLTAAGTLAGLVSLAMLSRYAWPVRGDYYGSGWKAAQAFRHTLIREHGGLAAACATLVAILASSVIAIVGRRTERWSLPTVFLAAFFPVCTACCVVLPLKRGVFVGGYEFRYITLPWLLMLAFYVTVGARVVATLAIRLRRRLPELVGPRWLAWSAGALGVAALLIGATCNGSLTMDGESDGSLAAAFLRCMHDGEQRAGLQDGLGNWWLARYLNAARHAQDWRSPYVVVQIQQADHPEIDPRDNDLLWFDGTYRHGAAKLNFLLTYAMSDTALGFFREHIGAPDRTLKCSAPSFYRKTPDIDIWIWDREDAQQRLADFVTHNSLRGAFSPAIGADQMSIDPLWGMQRSAPGVPSVVEINRMYLPSGHYRIQLDVAATGPTGVDPVAEIAVFQEHPFARRRASGQHTVGAGETRPSLEFDVDNRGGATSGADVAISVTATAGHSIDVSGATLTLLDQRGISPFAIFR